MKEPLFETHTADPGRWNNPKSISFQIEEIEGERLRLTVIDDRVVSIRPRFANALMVYLNSGRAMQLSGNNCRTAEIRGDGLEWSKSERGSTLEQSGFQSFHT